MGFFEWATLGFLAAVLYIATRLRLIAGLLALQNIIMFGLLRHFSDDGAITKECGDALEAWSKR